MKYALSMFTTLLAGAVLAVAGTDRTVDLRQFMQPIVVDKNSPTANGLEFMQPYMLNHAAAQRVFAMGDQKITLTNVPMPTYGTQTLHLELCKPVFDATSEFVVATKNGKKRITVPPVYSYRGTVDGELGSVVSLHYGNGNLTGFVVHADGARTMVGAAPEYRAIEGASPHVFQAESAGGALPSLSDFTCGNEDLPFDEKDGVYSMVMPSSNKGGASVQALELKELKLALVLREDVDSALKAKGFTDQQVADRFVKIVAAMSQAYEQEIGVHMFIGSMLVWTMDNPSGYLNDGKNPGDLLDEFSLDWSSGYKNVDRTVAHLYCIKKPVAGQYVGGIAYGGQAGSRLCIKDHRGAYGVSTLDLNPNEAIPGAAASRNAFVWDVFVAAHEIGHNVGAAHTHSCFWSPPVDTCQLCPQVDGTDGCYCETNLRKVRLGTIMSYCHLVNGSSTPLTFGSRVAERMRTWVDASCMKLVSAPMVRITEPRGDETWSGGEKVTILWVSTMVNNINLEYSLNGGVDWLPIASNLNAVDQKYEWTLPNAATANLYIRISDVSNPSVSDTSLAAYTIRVPLAISSPAGGERLGVGSNTTIRWSKESTVGNVNLFFSANNGQDWKQIASSQSGSAYEWTVEDAVTETGRIKIESVINKTIYAISSQFAIGNPYYALDLPREGGTLCNNFDNQFMWGGDFLDRFRIQYSVDGTSWKSALQVPYTNLSKWTIWSLNNSMTTLTPGTKVKLRVVDYNDTSKILDTRNELEIISCTGVTSVNATPDASARFSITAVTPNPAATDVMVHVQHASPLVLNIELVDVSGARRTLLGNVALEGQGGSVISVPLGNTVSGAYRIMLTGNGMSADAPLRVVR
jgi:hypothetical protein